MLANINEDYILIEIEPPFIPEKSVSNDKRLIVIFPQYRAMLEFYWQ